MNRLKENKGQIAPFMIIIAVLLILAIVATMIIGETGFQRIRLANIADSALLTGASSLCRSLNQIRMMHSTMFLNYLSLQVAMFASSPWPDKSTGYAAAMGWSLLGIESNMELYNQAKKIASEATKDLRTGLYEKGFGGGMIDEPIPFKESEVVRNPDTGRITKLDYDQYLATGRLSNFPEHYLKFKKGEAPYAAEGGKDNWFKKPLLTYQFNKSNYGYRDNKGKLIFSSKPAGDNTRFASYESYYSVELEDIPDNITVNAQVMPIFFLYATPSGCCMIGIIPHPYAWISRIDMDNNIFSIILKKLLPFGRRQPAADTDKNQLPFVGLDRDVQIHHKSTVRVRGSLWSGYEFRLEE